MTTLLLYSPDQMRDKYGRFAPGGGVGGGTSAARMRRIERQTAHASVKHGITRQCAWCGKMLNGPMKGQKLSLPHRGGGNWSHGMCASCAAKASQYARERHAGRISARVKAWHDHAQAMQQDQHARIEASMTQEQQAGEGVVGMRLADIWRRPIQLTEGADGQCRSWIMLMPEGDYEHPDYGKLHFTRKKLAEFKANFDSGVRKIDIALDADHKATQGDSRATGWIESMQLRPAQGDLPAGLWACIAWTSYGAQLLHDRIYRYFSPEFGDYTDEENGTKHQNVIIGGALTNRPFLKVMPSVALAETSNRPWSSVDKSNLPKSCFLWVAGPNKSDWHLPVYESNGAGGRGKLNLNGLKAAYAAMHGARSGKSMSLPAGVRSRLVSLYNKYFGASASKAAHEGMKGGAMASNRFQLAAKTPLRPKASGAPTDASDVDEYDPGDEDDPTQFDDGEEDASLDDAEDGESYDDTAGDDEPDGDEPFGGKKAPAFGKGGKQMRAKTASKSGGRKMSESETSRQLAEQQQQLAEMRQQMAEQAYQIYVRDVDDTLRAWSNGKTMTFVAAELPRLPKGSGNAIGGKRVERQRTIELTPAAQRKIRDFLIDDGFRLSEGRRAKVLDLIQFLLSERATIDTTRYGSSFDQESRKTISLSARRGEVFEGMELQEQAESLAAQAGKDFSTLSLAEKQHYYLLAEQEA